MMQKFPNLTHERELWEKGFTVIGIDEVGRGAFAGPLVLGGVIFPPTTSGKKIKELLSFGINDSKKLKKAQRENLDLIIKKEAFVHICESVSVQVINSVGIGRATHMGVRNLVRNLRKNVEKLPRGQSASGKNFFLLIDAFYIKYIHGIGLKNQKAIIHGDEISLSIAAASVIAKVHRDNLMTRLSVKYPQYGFERHVGYGTRKHRLAIIQYGKTIIHREGFVKKTLSIDARY